MRRVLVFVAYFFIAAATLLQAAYVHATEAAYRGAVAANWCNYLGPDCKPYGLSVRAQWVFKFLTVTDLGLLGGVTRYEATKEITDTEAAVTAGDPVACYEARELARAMRHASVPSTRRLGRGLFELVSQKCD
jgi:hypothetical protein|nr:MAG TPA: hypothetical protein [Caudoviricetes sp.]